ncbi:hypothetical protein H0H93_007189 [Arthromyces matolae]|nr:hypothetical protein H0H93_007189 [Arthromyces matolae]
MSVPVSEAILTQILAQLNALQVQQQTMQAKLDALSGATVTKGPGSPLEPARPKEFETLTPVSISASSTPSVVPSPGPGPLPISTVNLKAPLTSVEPNVGSPPTSRAISSDKEREKLLYPGRVNLTSLSPFSKCALLVYVTKASNLSSIP